MRPMLAVDSVARRYGPVRVLDDVTFAAQGGEVVGVIGPNGAGKTTLLRLIVGLLRPHRGEVRVEGGSIPAVLSRVRIRYFAGEHTIPGGVRMRRWQSLFQPVEGAGDRRRARILSRGTRQLAGLHLAFGNGPAHLIVLDEPWEGLDPDASRWLTDAIRERRRTGTTVLVSSHRLHDLAGVCERYVFLHAGTATVAPAHELAPAGTAVTGDSLLARFDLIRGRRA